MTQIDQDKRAPVISSPEAVSDKGAEDVKFLNRPVLVLVTLILAALGRGLLIEPRVILNEKEDVSTPQTCPWSGRDNRWH